VSAVGAGVGRLEDLDLLLGRARFVDDLDLAGTLEVAFARSPHAHATFDSIERAAALALPGVRAVYTHADLLPRLTGDRMPLPRGAEALPETAAPFVLARDEVCFVGEAVAMVVADDRYIAEDALALLEIDYEPLPAVADCRAALAPDAPRVHRRAADNVVARFSQRYGDCAEAFAAAPHVFQVALKQHRGAAHPIEGRGVVARHDPQHDLLTVWTSTQMPHGVRNLLVELLGLDENRVRVVVPDVGGGFGSKNIVYPEEVAVALAALDLKRPVKWIEDRREHFLASVQERDQYWDLEVAVDADGRLLALRGDMIHDQGAYTLKGINLPYNASTSVPGPYLVPNYRLDVTVAETSKVGTIPVRGAGYPEATFAMERVMDRIARELGLDRAELRRRNLIGPERMPYRTPMTTRGGTPVSYDSGDYPAVQAAALEAIGYAAFDARRAAAREAGRSLGIGFANCVKGTGRGPFESAIVRVGGSGRVSVYSGAAAMGQGTRTTLAQICAEQFGLEPGAVEVVAGDTATVPLGLGGFASRQTVTAGSATHLAARQVRDKALEVAAHMLEVAAADLELAGGEIRVLGAPGRSVALGEVAKALSGAQGYALPGDIGPGLEASVNFMPPGLTYGNACHAVELEVDVGTGAVTILKYVAVNDSGRLVNPMIAEGQLQGGVAHGIGNALFEWMGYDEAAQPVTTNFGEYLLPTSTEVPNVEIRHMESPSPLNPLGVKGIGEAGVIPAAAAVISAVEDALEPFGVTITETPVTPAKLVALIAAARAGA
jgi:carbon-monoxide dehydrogenase large subunit